MYHQKSSCEFPTGTILWGTRFKICPWLQPGALHVPCAPARCPSCPLHSSRGGWLTFPHTAPTSMFVPPPSLPFKLHNHSRPKTLTPPPPPLEAFDDSPSLKGISLLWTSLPLKHWALLIWDSVLVSKWEVWVDAISPLRTSAAFLRPHQSLQRVWHN